MVHKEVHNLVTNGGGSLTVDQCTGQCDSLFALAGDNELITDNLCQSECQQ